MTEPRYIRFVGQWLPEGRVTRVWIVETKTSPPEHLGVVKWWGGWRKYCFFPGAGTLFEQDCLRDIAAFCEDETTKHRARREVVAR